MENEACFIFPLNGHSTLLGRDSKVEISSEEGVLVKCGRYINIWHNKKDDSPNDVVVIHLHPEVIKKVYQDQLPEFLKAKPSDSTICLHVIKYQEALANFIKGLIFYFDNPLLTDEEFVKLKLKEFMLLLHNTGNKDLQNLLAHLFDDRKIAFRDIIECNLFEDFSLEEYAFMTNLSLSSFKRRFKELYNSPPAKYLKERKLERAADLLQHSKQSITEISLNIGISDSKLLAKNFKTAYGVSPTEYRKSFELN